MFRIVFCPVFSSVVGLIKIKLKRCVGELDDSTQGSRTRCGEGRGTRDGTAQACHGAPPTQWRNEAISVLVCLRREDKTPFSYPTVTLKPIRHPPTPRAKGSLTVAT